MQKSYIIPVSTACIRLCQQLLGAQVAIGGVFPSLAAFQLTMQKAFLELGQGADYAVSLTADNFP